MKKLTFAAGVMLAVVALAVPALAEEGAGKGKDHRFKNADTNEDGKLSLEEFKADIVKNIGKRFELADADKDGFLTRAELKAAHGKRPGKGDRPDDEPAD